MAGTELVKEVLWRAAGLLQDQTPQFQRWTEVELVNWLNDAQTAITKYLPAACTLIASVKQKPGTRQTIESIAPADIVMSDGTTPSTAVLGNVLIGVVRNMGADGLTPGKVIRIVARDIMDSQSPMWHTVTGPAINSYTFDPETPRYYYVTPGVPASPAVLWAELKFSAQPRKIPNNGTLGAELYLVDGTSTTTISLPDEYVEDLVNYIVARANMKDADYADGNKAAAFANLFTSSLNGKVTALTGNNPNLQRLPLAPAPLGQAK